MTTSASTTTPDSDRQTFPIIEQLLEVWDHGCERQVPEEDWRVVRLAVKYRFTPAPGLLANAERILPRLQHNAELIAGLRQRALQIDLSRKELERHTPGWAYSSALKQLSPDQQRMLRLCYSTMVLKQLSDERLTLVEQLLAGFKQSLEALIVDSQEQRSSRRRSTAASLEGVTGEIPAHAGMVTRDGAAAIRGMRLNGRMPEVDRRGQVTTGTRGAKRRRNQKK